VNVIDQTAGATHQGYRLDRVYRLGEHTVRVRIERDTYDRQSCAVAEVLNDRLTWTNLVTALPSAWHGATPYRAADVDDIVLAVGSLSDELIARASVVLGV
jgi:hypothetical protein